MSNDQIKAREIFIDHAKPLYEIHALIDTVADSEKRSNLHFWFTLVMDELNFKRAKEAGEEPWPSTCSIWMKDVTRRF